MGINIKSKSGLRCLYNQKTLVFVSLLFMTVLVSSCFVYAFSGVSPFVSGVPDIIVNNETELINAINNAPSKTSIIIALNNDISLSSTLIIPANKDITLTSNRLFGFYKLIGAEGRSTVFVDGGGVLRLDGVIVTHVNYAGRAGGGVYVEATGQLILYSGEISGNTVVGGGSLYDRGAVGGGVFNLGVFEMYGGKISKNSAGSSDEGSGGGVINRGTFTMSGGEISDNDADVGGGGVSNTGNFIMSGGTIANNHAGYWGGGVSNYGVFERLGGVISDNTAGVSGADNVYPNEGSSDGPSNGSDSGDGGGSGSDGSGGSSNGNGGVSSGYGFSLRDVVIVCVGVVGLTAVVVAVSLFVYFGKRMKQVEKKLNMSAETYALMLVLCSGCMGNVFNGSIRGVFKRLSA